MLQSGDTRVRLSGDQNKADRLLKREPLLVLDHFGVVEPLLGVSVRFLEALPFEEFDEVRLGAGATMISKLVEKQALNAEIA
ncbi:MAG: hypothetical protein J07HQW2_03829 [Haloquadratum walsbyi J07HQW2]|uniref:Uncharacterized protein n=1 Tax=Haloquadratum walsbyi J07HQW2 TaxID=1238425 RepID=U1NK54_9EURY|nr:hypothetical protein [Haloquadratum walsbyi]ERG97343.1 MAG: hypothetical protein J07HQW2_03829 [Haloquadratum walsbyi J07HQW2]